MFFLQSFSNFNFNNMLWFHFPGRCTFTKYIIYFGLDEYLMTYVQRNDWNRAIWRRKIKTINFLQKYFFNNYSWPQIAFLKGFTDEEIKGLVELFIYLYFVCWWLIAILVIMIEQLFPLFIHLNFGQYCTTILCWPRYVDRNKTNGGKKIYTVDKKCNSLISNERTFLSFYILEKR